METKEIKSEDLRNLILKQPVYLFNDYEEAVIRTEPGEEITFYIKFHGGTEFEAKDGSELITDTLLQPLIISEEDYKKY